MTSGAIVRCSLTFLLLSLLCSSHSPGQPADSVAVHDILSVLQHQVAAWNTGDIEGYMQGYWKSDSLLFTSSGRIQRGWQATLKKYQTAYGTKAKMGALSFSGMEVTILSPGSAWVFGHWKLMRDGDQPGGVFTLILRRFDDGWRIIHDHTSVEPPKNAK